MPTDTKVNNVINVNPAKPDALINLAPASIAVIDNPRTEFDPEAMAQLSASIDQLGIIEPLIVQELSGGGYTLVCGERRLRAAISLGMEWVPCVVRPDTGDGDTATVRLVENLCRRDLNPIEEAHAYEGLKRIGLSQQDIARRTGRSEASISNTLRLLKLPDKVQGHIKAGALTAAHGAELLRMSDQDDCIRMADDAFKWSYSVVTLRNQIKSAEYVRSARTKPEPPVSSTKPAAPPAPIDTTVNNVTNVNPSPPPAPSPAATPPPAPEPPAPTTCDPVLPILHNIDARLTSVKAEADRLPYTQLQYAIAAAIRACATAVDIHAKETAAPIDTNVNTVNNVKPSAVDVAVPAVAPPAAAAAVPAPWKPAVGDIIRMVGRPGARARIKNILCTRGSNRIAADIIGLTSGKLAIIHPDDWAQWELNPEASE